MIHRVHGIVVQTPTPISLYCRQPGLTYRSICPSIPGLGAGGTPPKTMPPRIGFVGLSTAPTALTELTALTEQCLQSRRNLTLTMVCWIPHIPRLPQINIIVGGVYGVKNRYILVCLLGRCLSPLTLVCALTPVFLDWGCPHPLIFCRPASPHNQKVVWFI